MNARHHVAALFATLLAVAGAHAQEGTQEFANQTLSTRGRSEVRAEFEAARSAGTLDRRNYASHSVDRASTSVGLTRAEVIAEFERARAAGELERRNYASYGAFESTRAASARSRADALAEVEKARAAGVRLSQGERSGS